MLDKLKRRVKSYAKIHQCFFSVALVVSVIRHQMVIVQTKHRKGRYDDLLRAIVTDDPSVKWEEERDVFSSTHAAVEDFILQWLPKNQQALYCKANDLWFRSKVLQQGPRPHDPGLVKDDWGRSFQS